MSKVRTFRFRGLRYVAAKKALVTVETPLARHKVCHITFGATGIFVQCPYFSHQDGIVSRVELANQDGPPYRFRLDEHGRITSHLVKLSHHSNGFAHFSQHGRVTGAIRRQSFPLTSIGLMFQLFAYFPRALDLFDQHERDDNRAILQFRSLNRHMFGIKIEGEWRRKNDMASGIRPIGATVGPTARLLHRRTGARLQAMFLAPPTDSKLSSHVLVVSCAHAEVPAGVRNPLIIVIGGWDPHEIQWGGQEVRQTGCLACLYPVGSPEALRAKLSSIDLEPPGRARR